MLIDGKRLPVKTWRDVLTTTCSAMASDMGGEFARRVLPLRGKKRTYFSENSDALIYPMQLVAGGVFVEGNLSANNIVRLARRVVTAVRGSDSGFSIEIGPPRSSKGRSEPS